ncbi:hypothetical protein Tco_1056805 [Tanacetum coccineum]|uniref:Uncharacterized protein n=1 Tax=Tanacetum coccineum TaxID=301880 RepID=A0ABQ5H5S3_9ASTR
MYPHKASNNVSLGGEVMSPEEARNNVSLEGEIISHKEEEKCLLRRQGTMSPQEEEQCLLRRCNVLPTLIHQSLHPCLVASQIALVRFLKYLLGLKDFKMILKVTAAQSFALRNFELEVMEFRKQENNEDTSSKEMLDIHGVGFDWSDMAEEQVQTNMALMAFSDSKFEKVKQEKEGIEFKIEKFDKASKDLDKLLGSQITDKSKKGLGYSAIPPPHPLIYNRPKKLDLSYYDDYKENYDDSLVKEQVSEDTSSLVESSLNVDKETVFPVDKKWVAQRHITGNIAYLLNFKEFDGGYVTFEGRHVKRGWDTKIPQSSGPPEKVGDEVVHKELGDIMERAATTASSLEAEQDSVDEIVTDVVDWAMQAPLRARFRDLSTIDMKEIIQQRMFEDNSYKAHDIYSDLYEALQKSLELDYSNQRLADQEEARKKERKQLCNQELLLGTSGSSQLPPPLPTSSTGASRSAQQAGSEAPSSSKHAASTHQSMAWTTYDTRFESTDFMTAQELSPKDSLMQDDSIPDEQVHLSDDEDSGNDHLPKADLRQDWWKPTTEEKRPSDS